MKIEEGLLLQYLESNMNLLKLFASEKITPLNLENFIRGTQDILNVFTLRFQVLIPGFHIFKFFNLYHYMPAETLSASDLPFQRDQI